MQNDVESTSQKNIYLKDTTFKEKERIRIK